jgi:hypothetical protein
MRTTFAALGAALLAGALSLQTARAIGIEDVVDGGNTYAWQEIKLANTMCGNGSQYKFYVYDNPGSNNLLVLFEGGGACWDYATCSGQAGILGAAHPNGIPDNYIREFQPTYVSPLVNGADPGIPPFRSKKTLATNGWDMVYMPYCTGDVHVGNNVVTYTDPTGQQPPITWRHVGYNNTTRALTYLKTRFPSVGKLLVTGFSAGGTVSSAGYYKARRTLTPTVKGYLLNDSGPIFPAPNSTYRSRPLHDLIKTQWALTTLYSELPATFNTNDFGSVTKMLATEFPSDQLAYTGYSSDYNYSRFSYERFYPGITQATVLSYWRQDQANLVTEMKKYANFSYHIPWHRPINASHCSSIITFIGSHACPTVRKKYWYEALELPWSQTWKCPSGNLPFETFLTNWLTNNQKPRVQEPQNNYNNEDPGMQIVAPLINDAIDG